MRTRLCGQYRLMVLALIALSVTAGIASAQVPDQRSVAAPSLAAVKTQVAVGEVIHVTDAAGTTVKGTLTALSDDAVQLRVKAGLRSVPAADVRRIQWQQRDSALTGVLIGAAAGAIPGIYWLIVDPNECTGMCPEEYAAIGVGAVVGGLIDRAITRKVTVYQAGGSRAGATSVAIGPLVTRDRKGVRVMVKF